MVGSFPGGGKIEGIAVKLASDVAIGGGGGTGQNEDPDDDGTSLTGKISPAPA